MAHTAIADTRVRFSGRNASNTTAARPHRGAVDATSLSRGAAQRYL